jgi:hypothetical protein
MLKTRTSEYDSDSSRKKQRICRSNEGLFVNFLGRTLPNIFGLLALTNSSDEGITSCSMTSRSNLRCRLPIVGTKCRIYTCNNLNFDGETLLAPRSTSVLDDHPLSVVRDCLFNVFKANLHICRRSPLTAVDAPHLQAVSSNCS